MSPAALVQVGLGFCGDNVLLVAGKERIKHAQLPFTLWICLVAAQDVFSVFSIRAASRRKVVS